ncbi:hypothetical protein CR513_24988, partial [Mucuna pruriens]
TLNPRPKNQQELDKALDPCSERPIIWRGLEVRSNNDKKYFNHIITLFCQKKRIIHELSYVKIQQNGVLERKRNEHLHDRTQAYSKKMFRKISWEKLFLQQHISSTNYLANPIPLNLSQRKHWLRQDHKWFVAIKKESYALGQNCTWSLYKARTSSQRFQSTISVYMTQPQGFEALNTFSVCRLHTMMYGLKQAPQVWFERLKTTFLQFGFKDSICNPSLFIYSHRNVLVYLFVYVDDIIITRSSSSVVQFVFSLKQLGVLD